MSIYHKKLSATKRNQKMNIYVEVISREIIKPSTTSTPDDHLHHYKLSCIDQGCPSVYVPLIYFYSLDDHKLSNKEKFSHLKASLSQVLNHYYPLAGIVKDTYVDCNNGGVLVLEAQVNCQLSEFLQNPLPSEFIKLLPDGVDDLVLGIQVNFFNCCSIAIGARISHKVADASSMTTFIKNWAETARGKGDKVRPEFAGVALFPPRDGIRPAVLTFENNIVLKRFVFSNSKIAELKGKYSKMEPTRYKVLLSFIWSRFAASTEFKKGSYGLITPVNLRKKMDPPLSDDSFGNIITSVLTIISSSENDTWKECYDCDLVNKLTESISKINKDHIQKLKDGIAGSYYSKEKLVYFSASSFCGYPVYDTDFGWGRPTWVVYGGLPYKNSIIFMDTKNGDGIDAWIHLTEDDMAKFGSDKELLAYASPHPDIYI
ncbi:hypothetical protein ACOSQ2_022099 [Xanthoceras sorbifolium]